MSELPGIELTLGFVQSRPDSAAEVLGELAHTTTARFLDNTPARIAAPAFTLMHADDAAAALQHMDPSRGAALIRAMGYADALTVLRLLPVQARDALYQELPGRFAEEVRKSLQYPLDTVGAWMEPSIPSFPAHSTVSEAMRYLRRHDWASLDHVFVLGPGRQLEGSVAIGTLLKADPATRVQALMSRELRPLSNRARLPVVRECLDWDTYSLLPVAGRKGNILGGLSRAKLRRGQRALSEVRPGPAGESVVARIFSALLISAAGLLRAGSAGSRRHD